MHKSSISSVEIATGMFMPVYAIFSILYFFRCSAIFLSFYVTFFMFISFPSTFLSCALLPCPSIIFSYPYPFIVLACHVQILTDRIFGMHDLGHHGAHNLYVWILKKNKYTLIQKHFLSCWHSFHAFHSPVSFLSVSFYFLPCSFYFRQSYLSFTFTLFNFPHLPLFFQFLSCPSDVPLVSLSVRLIFLLIFLSCPFHFTLLSLQFPSLFPSSHSIFLVCPVIFQNHIECPCIFVSNYVHGPWFFSWSSLLVYASGCQLIMW